jgi:hypothetical protein
MGRVSGVVVVVVDDVVHAVVVVVVVAAAAAAARCCHDGPGLEVDDAVLAPLVLLHGLLPVKLLVADVALERAAVAVRALVDLQKRKNSVTAMFTALHIT